MPSLQHFMTSALLGIFSSASVTLVDPITVWPLGSLALTCLLAAVGFTAVTVLVYSFPSASLHLTLCLEGSDLGPGWASSTFLPFLNCGGTSPFLGFLPLGLSALSSSPGFSSAQFGTPSPSSSGFFFSSVMADSMRLINFLFNSISFIILFLRGYLLSLWN
mgnify:CR=1 FL=1